MIVAVSMKKRHNCDKEEASYYGCGCLKQLFEYDLSYKERMLFVFTPRYFLFSVTVTVRVTVTMKTWSLLFFILFFIFTAIEC